MRDVDLMCAHYCALADYSFDDVELLCLFPIHYFMDFASAVSVVMSRQKILYLHLLMPIAPVDAVSALPKRMLDLAVHGNISCRFELE